VQLSGSHATEDQLENYTMGRLSDSEVSELEEHLFICPTCQDAWAASEAAIGHIRHAASMYLREAGSEARPWYRTLFVMPRLAGALSLAAAALLLAVGIQQVTTHRSAAPPALVMLQSMRGPEARLNATVAAGKPFVLSLDLTDLAQLPSYRLEIVDADGHSVFQSSAAPRQNRLQAAVSRGLPGGSYYVRVYRSAPELLREYELEVAH